MGSQPSLYYTAFGEQFRTSAREITPVQMPLEVPVWDPILLGRLELSSGPLLSKRKSSCKNLSHVTLVCLGGRDIIKTLMEVLVFLGLELGLEKPFDRKEGCSRWSPSSEPVDLHVVC